MPLQNQKSKKELHSITFVPTAIGFECEDVFTSKEYRYLTSLLSAIQSHAFRYDRKARK